MSKAAVVYWSGTGNTEAMAHAVTEGAKGAGAEAELFTASEFTPDKAAGFDAIAFGCPSMGAEVLEEEEFQPMWDACKGSLAGKKSPSSDPMDGATGNGCGTGKPNAATRGSILRLNR